MSYYGDLSDKFVSANQLELGYHLYAERLLAKRSGIYLRLESVNGHLLGSDRAPGGWVNGTSKHFDRSLNFRTSVHDLNTSVIFYLGSFKKKEREPFINAYIRAGIGVGLFDVYGDLKDSEGNFYNYWEDGTIRTLPENDVNASGAEVIRRDNKYETNLRKLAVEEKYNKFKWQIPVGLGLKMRLGDIVSLIIDAQYTLAMTDYLDNVGAGKISRALTSPEAIFAADPTGVIGDNYRNLGKSNGKNDSYLYVSAGLNFNIGKNLRPKFKVPVFYPGTRNLYVPAETEKPESSDDDYTEISETDILYTDSIFKVVFETNYERWIDEDNLTAEHTDSLSVTQNEKNENYVITYYSTENDSVIVLKSDTVYTDPIKKTLRKGTEYFGEAQTINPDSLFVNTQTDIEIQIDSIQLLDERLPAFSDFDSIGTEFIQPDFDTVSAQDYSKILSESDTAITETEDIPTLEKTQSADRVKVESYDTLTVKDTEEIQIPELAKSDSAIVEIHDILLTPVSDDISKMGPDTLAHTESEVKKPDTITDNTLEDKVQSVTDSVRNAEIEELKNMLKELGGNAVQSSDKTEDTVSSVPAKKSEPVVSEPTDQTESAIQSINEKLGDIHSQISRIKAIEDSVKFYGERSDSKNQNRFKAVQDDENKKLQGKIDELEKHLKAIETSKAEKKSVDSIIKVMRTKDVISALIATGVLTKKMVKKSAQKDADETREKGPRVKVGFNYNNEPGYLARKKATVIQNENDSITSTVDTLSVKEEISEEVQLKDEGNAEQISGSIKVSDTDPIENETVSPKSSGQLLSEENEQLKKQIADIRNSQDSLIALLKAMLSREEKPAPTSQIIHTSTVEKQEDYTQIIENILNQPISRVFFAVGKSEVENQYKLNLDRIANQLKNYSELSVELKGFADPTGNAASNLKLSEKRALAVKNYLESVHNISPSRIKTLPVGQENDSKNLNYSRRVEVKLIR